MIGVPMQRILNGRPEQEPKTVDSSRTCESFQTFHLFLVHPIQSVGYWECVNVRSSAAPLFPAVRAPNAGGLTLKEIVFDSETRKWYAIFELSVGKTREQRLT